MWSYFSQADLAGCVAAILEIALAVDLDVLPGEFLAQPVEAGLAGHAHDLFALRRVDLLLEKDVDTQGVDAGMGNRRHVGRSAAAAASHRLPGRRGP